MSKKFWVQNIYSGKIKTSNDTTMDYPNMKDCVIYYTEHYGVRNKDNNFEIPAKLIVNPETDEIIVVCKHAYAFHIGGKNGNYNFDVNVYGELEEDKEDKSLSSVHNEISDDEGVIYE